MSVTSKRKNPPPEIVEMGPEAIEQYFVDSVDYLYEAKLIIVGEPGAGKTTLAKKIVDPDYPLTLDEASTEGIDVLQWRFELENGQPFRVNIWDFGGQEIYHNTHQFFLTSRSLYVLVADVRREDTDFYYWLNIIEGLGGNSPLLIVKNEKQDRRREINERQLRGQFAILKETLATNLETNRGLKQVRDSIKYHISHLPHIGNMVPKTWVNVRQALEQDSRPYISLETYLDICQVYDFERLEDKLQLSGYLHDMGICLHFQNDPLLRKTVILNPQWGTDAVYRILDNHLVINNFGRFTREDLAKIWYEDEFAYMQDELLRLMLNFQLCYEIPNSEGTYIAPQLLTENQPEYYWVEADNLILRYTYEFMPKGILPRLIVRMRDFITDQSYMWRSGVVLSKDETQAEVIEYYYKREIRIRLVGKHKRDLLNTVTYELDAIHSSYHRLKYSQLIPCNCTKCNGSQNPHFYPFERLKAFVAHGKISIECDKSFESINVFDLLGELVEIGDQSEQLIVSSVEFVNQDISTLDSYIRSFETQETRHLFEAKLLIVGEPGAGKTSLMKKLLDSSYPVPNEEDPTLGIEVVSGWRFPYQNDQVFDFIANIWDFGGHQIQYMIHQFFLTPGSLYVLVADDREQRTEFDYWFNMIYLLGKGSPVLVVLNERNYKSITNFDVNRYKKQFGDKLIIERRDVDLANDDGRIKATRNKIQTMLSELDHIGDKLPKQWIAIRRDLELLRSEHHISAEEYFEICEKHGLEEEIEQLRLSRYLHNLGVILHFQGDSSLADYIFLDPQWISDAMYKIFSSKELVRNSGKFSKDWLFSIWKRDGYKYEERNKLLSLMQKNNFELCYPIPFTGKIGYEYIASQFLPSVKPIYFWDNHNNLQFRFQYPFMPKGIISRLIVRLHPYVCQDEGGNDLVWKHGAVFTKEDASTELNDNMTKAQVTEDVTKEGLKTIHIRVTGSPSKRKELLTIIREEIKRIHESPLRGIPCEEMIPCNCSHCRNREFPDYFSYETLSRFSHDQKLIQCHISGDMLDPWSLIDDVIGEKQFIEEETEKGRVVFRGDVNVDQIVYQEAKQMFTNVMETKMIKEKVIEIGDNNKISAPIVIADSIESSFNALRETTVEKDVKILLEQLLKAINEISKKVPKDKLGETEIMARDAETLVKEASASKPRQKWYEISLEGLKQAAVNIGEIADPVLNIVKKLIPLLLT